MSSRVLIWFATFAMAIGQSARNRRKQNPPVMRKFSTIWALSKSHLWFFTASRHISKDFKNSLKKATKSDEVNTCRQNWWKTQLLTGKSLIYKHRTGLSLRIVNWNWEGWPLKHIRVVRVDSLNGDTHFVLLESQLPDSGEIAEELDEVEIKRTSKQDASKPLVLVRSE